MLTSDEKKDACARLSKAKGQIATALTMIEDDKSHSDVIQALKTCTGALKGVARLVVESYLRSLVKQLVQAKSTDAKNRGVDEVVDELIKSAELFPGGRPHGR